MKLRKKIHDNWETPKEITQWIKVNFGNYFDPCPLNPKFNGLLIPWKKVNFVNPPYTRKLKELFVKKGINEMKKGRKSIFLLPASTDTNLFHNYIWKNAESILFIEGRIRFKGYNTKGEYVTDKTGQTGNMIVIFDPMCDYKFHDPNIDVIRKGE